MRIPLLVALTVLAACGPFPRATPPNEDSVDAGSQDAGDEGDAGGDPTMPFSAPARTWTYVPIDGAVCANGSATGVAVNIEPDATELVLYLQGGGACWESFACLDANNGQGTSTHLRHDVGEERVLGEATTPQFFFDRSQPANPFRAANYIYVPYCTGDLHIGNNAKTYQPILGAPVVVEHRGGRNIEKLLERLVEELPALEHIRFVGVSAGGYGVTLNWWRVLEAYPEAQVDVLNDSGPPIPTSGGQYGTMRSAWNPDFPPDCTDCATSLTNYLPFYATSVPAPHRYALLAYSHDEVVRAFFGYGFDTATYENRIDTLIASMGDRQRAFRLDGTKHVMLANNPLPQTSDGVSLLDWIEDFAGGAEPWNHEGP